MNKVRVIKFSANHTNGSFMKVAFILVMAVRSSDKYVFQPEHVIGSFERQLQIVKRLSKM